MDYQHFRMFFFNIFKVIWISDIEYDPSDNLNCSLHVGADILNLLLLCELFTFFHVL